MQGGFGRRRLLRKEKVIHPGGLHIDDDCSARKRLDNAKCNWR
jgi:hypothetical protein